MAATRLAGGLRLETDRGPAGGPAAEAPAAVAGPAAETPAAVAGPADSAGGEAARRARYGDGHTDHAPAGLAAAVAGGRAEWPYTWGRVFRVLDLPFNLLYRVGVTRTLIVGGEHVEHLPRRVIFAGTHHGFADVPLVQRAIAKTAARRLAKRLVITAAAGGVGFASAWSANVGILCLGLYPLERGERREASLWGLRRLVERGNAVLIFPQGTHATPEQEIADDPAVRFRPGVAHLAADLDAVVVPFGLAGTERLIPPDADSFQGLKIAGIPVSLKPGPLAIGFGAPLRREPDEPPRAFAERVQAASYAATRAAEAALRQGG